MSRATFSETLRWGVRGRWCGWRLSDVLGCRRIGRSRCWRCARNQSFSNTLTNLLSNLCCVDAQTGGQLLSCAFDDQVHSRASRCQFHAGSGGLGLLQDRLGQGVDGQANGLGRVNLSAHGFGSTHLGRQDCAICKRLQCRLCVSDPLADSLIGLGQIQIGSSRVCTHGFERRTGVHGDRGDRCSASHLDAWDGPQSRGNFGCGRDNGWLGIRGLGVLQQRLTQCSGINASPRGHRVDERITGCGDVVFHTLLLGGVGQCLDRLLHVGQHGQALPPNLRVQQTGHGSRSRVRQYRRSKLRPQFKGAVHDIIGVKRKPGSRISGWLASLGWFNGGRWWRVGVEWSGTRP